MSAQISFLSTGGSFPINNLSGSGLGFFGPGGFGTSVPVGSYSSTTFITNGNGTTQGPQINNVSYVHPISGQVNGSTILNVLNIPNYQGTLNIHFTNSTPVTTNNGYLYIYDRVNLNNAASGVTCACLSLIHPDSSQLTTGSGSAYWEFPSASSVCYLSKYNNGNAYSPGQSGYGVSGANTVDGVHDFYVALSASPNSVGSKTLFGLYVSINYF